MSHITSIFAMTIESEVDNLTTTVANHYICVINTISSRPTPPVLGAPTSYLGPAGLLQYTSTAICPSVPPLHSSDDYSLEMIINEFDVISVVTRTDINRGSIYLVSPMTTQDMGSWAVITSIQIGS
ncbi:hypothetical protein BC829DRAFT_441317 [Chytridium lagenaria]|nr:hypothetical protein BC829DRAFT_441317 [Chytridium lagenaria]